MTRAEINTKIKKLLEYRKVVQSSDSAIIGTQNKKTGWYGCASFLNDGESIKVFEGNGDGSDDKVMSFYEFAKKYSFGIANDITGELIGDYINED